MLNSVHWQEGVRVSYCHTPTDLSSIVQSDTWNFMEYIVSGSGRACHAGSLGSELSFKPAFSAYHVTAIHVVVVIMADHHIKSIRTSARAHNASQLSGCLAIVTVAAELVANFKTHLTAANPDIHWQRDPRFSGPFKFQGRRSGCQWNPRTTQNSLCFTGSLAVVVCSTNIPLPFCSLDRARCQ